jgi:integrase
MAKKAAKAKEPIRLREKVLSNGNKSLYLDIYRDGKRVYEFLKLYLIPETASDPTAKMRNKQTLVQANAIKAQRVIELTNNEAGVINKSRGKLLIEDWANESILRAEKRGVALSTLGMKKSLMHKIKGFKGNVSLCDIDKDYCRNFIDYLRNGYKKTNGKGLSEKSVLVFTAEFTALLNEAVREDLIIKNPMNMLSVAEKPHKTESTREHLTEEEVKKLKATPCKYPELKRAFLFSCYCGLRLSDVSALTWKNIETLNGKYQIVIVQKKTKQPLYIPISKNQLEYLPPKSDKSNDTPLFNLPTPPTIERVLGEWATDAGITKHITFHVSRHTFATILLTEGADLYTTSKLLGHTDISTTQIYAKIVNKKKEEAMSLMDKIFGNDNK